MNHFWPSYPGNCSSLSETDTYAWEGMKKGGLFFLGIPQEIGEIIRVHFLKSLFERLLWERFCCCFKKKQRLKRRQEIRLYLREEDPKQETTKFLRWELTSFVNTKEADLARRKEVIRLEWCEVWRLRPQRAFGEHSNEFRFNFLRDGESSWGMKYKRSEFYVQEVTAAVDWNRVTKVVTKVVTKHEELGEIMKTFCVLMAEMFSKVSMSVKTHQSVLSNHTTK